MAEWRKIHTKFWVDPEWLDFTPEDRYFYLCLLTNPKTTACGVYEVHIKEFAMWTGYNTETIVKLLEHFVSAGKIEYDEKTHEVFIRNWFRYNSPKSPKLQALILDQIEQIKSPRIREMVLKQLKLSLGDTVSIPYRNGMETVSETVSDTVSDTVSKKSAGDYRDIETIETRDYRDIETKDLKSKPQDSQENLAAPSDGVTASTKKKKAKAEVPVEYAKPILDAWQTIHRLPDGSDPLTEGDYAILRKVIRQLWRDSVILDDVLGTIKAIGELKKLDPNWAIAKAPSILKHISSYRDGTLQKHIEALKRRRPMKEVFHEPVAAEDFRRRKVP